MRFMNIKSIFQSIEKTVICIRPFEWPQLIYKRVRIEYIHRGKNQSFLAEGFIMCTLACQSFWNTTWLINCACICNIIHLCMCSNMYFPMMHVFRISTIVSDIVQCAPLDSCAILRLLHRLAHSVSCMYIVIYFWKTTIHMHVNIMH